jgi:single-stranded DNA-binding protein
MNRVLLVGRLTRDRDEGFASGRSVTTFSIATTESVATDPVTGEKTADVEMTEYHASSRGTGWPRPPVWLGKRDLVAVSGKLRPARGTTMKRHWKTEVVATSVERLTKVAADVGPDPGRTDGAGRDQRLDKRIGPTEQQPGRLLQRRAVLQGRCHPSRVILGGCRSRWRRALPRSRDIEQHRRRQGGSTADTPPRRLVRQLRDVATNRQARS